jgi:four helix bundle protein
MSTIRSFEDIVAWQKGRELKREVYQITRLKPFAHDFVLVQQIRRAAISVTANIAEGFERGGKQEFIQFLGHSKGSCGEVRDHLYTAVDEGYITKEQFEKLCAAARQVSSLIAGFRSYLQGTEIRGLRYKVPPTKVQLHEGTKSKN